ncbi:unnamed protein product [Cochlearia groenlandica]
MVGLELEHHGGLVSVLFGKQREIRAETARHVLLSPRRQLVPGQRIQAIGSVPACAGIGSSCTHKIKTLENRYCVLRLSFVVFEQCFITFMCILYMPEAFHFGSRNNMTCKSHIGRAA